MTKLAPNFLDCEQGKEAWFASRCGMVTSSRVAAAIARLKRKSKSGEPGDPSAARINLCYELAGEILTRKPAKHFVSDWMELGKENEPLARAAYEIETDTDVTQVGFVLHPSMDRCGASPDGLIIGSMGLVEFKCPKVETHFRYIEAGVIPEEYRPQMIWQMACCGPEWEWNDFVSFCPDLPQHLQTFIAPRMMRDDAVIAEMEEEVRLFWSEVDARIEKITAGRGGESLTETKLRQSIALVKSRKQQKQEQEEADILEIGEEIVL